VYKNARGCEMFETRLLQRWRYWLERIEMKDSKSAIEISSQLNVSKGRRNRKVENYETKGVFGVHCAALRDSFAPSSRTNAHPDRWRFG
jgi:hypothetical protein